jgi:serine/threonine-protein kinase HipA
MFKKVSVLNVEISGRRVGRLTLTKEYLAAFEYDSSWLNDGFSVSPFYLPLKPGVFIARKSPFNGLFGVFNDSLPDSWGNLILDRLLLKNGINPQSLSVIDRLSITGSNGMGALCYQPANHFTTESDSKDILFLAAEAEKMLKSDYNKTVEILVKRNGSSGGARPKIILKLNDGDWLVKFPHSSDKRNIGKKEFLYAQIARKCGIEMPETRLFEGKYFGVKRFDIEGGIRFHVHTASGLLYADHRLPSLDYADLCKATWALTGSIEEVKKIFRLMVFNILTGNRDDHASNFSFIYKNGWKTAPAYDLTPSSGFYDHHSTTVAGQGKPCRSDIMNVAEQVGINAKMARTILDEVYENSTKIRAVSL